MIRRVNIHIDRLTLDGVEPVGETALQTELRPVIEAAVQAHRQDRAPNWPVGTSPAMQKIGTRVHSEMAGATAPPRPQKAKS